MRKKKLPKSITGKGAYGSLLVRKLVVRLHEANVRSNKWAYKCGKLQSQLRECKRKLARHKKSR